MFDRLFEFGASLHSACVQLHLSAYALCRMQNIQRATVLVFEAIAVEALQLLCRACSASS
jgi:hypothetical protein